MMKALPAGCLALAIIASTAVKAKDEWVIEKRTLPVPAGASPEIQQAIASADQPDVQQSLSYRPSSEAVWRMIIDGRASADNTSLAESEKQLGVSIERDEIAGVKVHRVNPAKTRPAHRDHIFVYIHGGAYVFGGGDAAVREGALISAVAGIPVVSIDYRMPPDHPHPAAIEDVESVYRELLKSYDASAIAMGGTSAGGGLSLGSVHNFKAKDLPVPGALYLGTPWADLTKTSDSLYTMEGIDRVLVTYDGILEAAALLYAGGTDLKDPLLSPVYGDFNGFPPSYFVTGTRDMFLSDTARTHRKMRAAGVVADLNVYEGISHAGYVMVPGSPEFQQTYGELSAFLEQHLGGD